MEDPHTHYRNYVKMCIVFHGLTLQVHAHALQYIHLLYMYLCIALETLTNNSTVGVSRWLLVQQVIKWCFAYEINASIHTCHAKVHAVPIHIVKIILV